MEASAQNCFIIVMAHLSRRSRTCKYWFTCNVWCLFAVTIFLSCFSTSGGFNLDTQAPIKFWLQSNTYFGYSVLLHENRNGKWLLVGAPKSDSLSQPGLQRPGAVYKCNLRTPSSECTQVVFDREGNQRSAQGERPLVLDAKDDQWLGVSLARQEGVNGKVVACGHLWANDYYSDAILPNGVCYIINSNLQLTSVLKERPCLHEIQIKADSHGKGIAWHGWCQAGFSAEYSIDGNTLLLGAVGSIAWRGTVISLPDSPSTEPAGTPSPVADVTSWFPVGDEDESYVGYSVSSGYFTSLTEVQGVTGAPRAYEHGRVYIYNLRDFTLYTEVHGPGMSSYFGARVLGMYLNSDAWTDLLVGAPLYSEEQDEGCVYIYRNEGFGVMIPENQLRGSRTPKSRFGSTIENVGDLNMDGFEDVAIGAPYEDNMAGAVYIYHGSQSGLKASYAQRITPSSFGTVLHSFGHSISGKLDIDANGYPDIAIGAYESGAAVVLLSKPVIQMEARLEFSKAPIDIKREDCLVGALKVSCVKAFVCFMYRGHAVPPEIPIEYTIETDWYKREKGLTARLDFFDKSLGQKIGPVQQGTILLEATRHKCITTEAHINTDMKDFLSPIPFKVNYTLKTTTMYGSHVTSALSCGHSGIICPVFDMYSANDFVELISFIHNCGNDSMCETDLQLKASTHIPRGTSYLPIGIEDFFYINIDVYNNGEEAHQAKVKIGHTDEISFINVRSDSSIESLVLCTPEKGVNESYVMCDVDNPMPPFSMSKFTVKMGIGALHPDTERINLFVEAMTSSMEHNTTLRDNSHILQFQTKIEADVTVRGVARPEHLIYDTDKDTVKKDKNFTEMDMDLPLDVGNITIMSQLKKVPSSKIGPLFQHVYDVRNLGPSSLPLLSTVNISFPWKTREGDLLTYIEDVRINGIGSCNFAAFENQTMDIQVWNSSTSMSDPQSSAQSTNPFSYGLDTLSCDTVECFNITCTVGSLRIGGGIVIEIEARLWQRTFKKIWSDRKGFLALVSNAHLTVNNPHNRHVQPANHRPDTDKVITRLYTEAAVQPSSVSKWLIALGFICGVACLLVLILIMWKMGFFKRPMREEMERLIQEKDEIENLNPDGFGDMNGFDQDMY